MSRKGNCYDNAPMESFWGTLKTELVHHRRYRTREEAREGDHRIHRGLLQPGAPPETAGYLSPAAYERRFYAKGGGGMKRIRVYYCHRGSSLCRNWRPLVRFRGQMDGAHGGIKDRFSRLGKNDRDAIRGGLAADNNGDTPPKVKQREECPHTPPKIKTARGVSPHRRPRGEEGATDRDSFMRTGRTCMSTLSLVFCAPNRPSHPPGAADIRGLT